MLIGLFKPAVVPASMFPCVGFWVSGMDRGQEYADCSIEIQSSEISSPWDLGRGLLIWPPEAQPVDQLL